LTYEIWRKVLSINFDSMFLMCKALLPCMKANGWGRVINISSSSVITSIPGISHYMASKMGVVGFTRGLDNDVAGYGITVNAVSPTLTQTPGADE
jgi:NAD(P)-dependent dehydrogenase (short-subunit alcohol dehydrogenase family)